MIDKISIPFESFKEILGKNSKILFSGIFGSGKTTFINDFFHSNDNYEGVHIYPVNYSVASNEDIFELIKYDVLFQLIGKVPKDEFLKLEIPYQLTLYTYLTSINYLDSKLDFLSSFLSFTGKYGSATLKVYEQLKYLKDKYIEFHNQFQEDDYSKVRSYLEKATTQKGHIYEEDLFTEIIRILISEIKKKDDKEVVLVIDDLDRLDPEHIFRIFNIFSAHIDFNGVEEDNKFDFDKVILVCDYNNIASVYKHRNGSDSNFNGYLDKFYNDIFWYNSSTYIQKIINQYFSKIKTGVDYDFFAEVRRSGGQILYTFKELLSYNLINFRSLNKYEMTFDLNSFYNEKAKNLSSKQNILKQYNLNGQIVVSFFLNFFNNDLELKNIIAKAKQKEISKGYHAYDADYFDMIGELLLLINYSKYDRAFINKTGNELFEIQYNDYLFKCRFIRNNYQLAVTCEEIFKEGIRVGADEINYFMLLEEAIEAYLDFIR